MHEDLSVLRDSHAFRQPGNTSQVFRDRMRWRADEKHQVHDWSIRTERHPGLAPPNYQKKPGDRFGPRVRKRNMILRCRGNCRLPRADALHEHAGINNGRVSMDKRTESSQALVEVGRPHIHQDTGWIHDRLELLRCHRSESTYGCDGDQTVSHAAAAEARDGESSSFIRKRLHRVAWGAHAYSRVFGQRPRRQRLFATTL